MDSGAARQIFTDYATAMAYVEVELPNGEISMGSAFHVGDGAFVTARHVVDGNRITEVGSTEHAYVRLQDTEAATARTFLTDEDGRYPAHRVDNGVMQIRNGPFLHSDDKVDVAVFQVEKIDPRTAIVELGGHLDDWIGRSDFTLFEAIVLGYPPIPMADRPTLIGARAEVNAEIDIRGTPHVHFVLSAMPRGGFSGGVAILEPGFALGMITQSLLTQGNPAELGYMTAVSIEPIYQCLADYKLLPVAQAEMWGDLWNSTSLDFQDPAEPRSIGVRFAAGVRVFDDGRRLALTIRCDTTDDAFQRAIHAARQQLSGYETTEDIIRDRMRRIDLVTTYSKQAIEDVFAAARAVAQMYIASGLTVIEHRSDTDPRFRP